MVTPRFFPYIGGVENHVQEVARRLAVQNVDLTVLTTDPSGRLLKNEAVDGYQVERVRAWPKNGDYYLAPGIYQTIRNGNWDLIHIQSYHTFVPPLAMLAAQQRHIPYVVTFHGGGHSSRFRNSIRNLQRKMLKPLLRRAERLIAVANFEIAQYGKELDVGPEDFVLIPNGCDLPKARTPLSKRQETLIVSVGRLERYKGHQRVIAAMPYILKEKPDARLWIAGSGPYEPELRRLVKKLCLQDQVQIRAVPMAERNTMADELSKAALFVLLSEFETHPIAVLEAVSLGVPALVADTSGLSELAKLGMAQSIPLRKDGREISEREIAQAISDQLDHPHLPASQDLPTWDDCAGELLRLYQSIIGSR
jgi:glycosyltransferase involved in cell wall biosynthesis